MAAKINHVLPPNLPVASGYSQVVEVAEAERTYYIAGQVPVDARGKVVGAGDFAAQAAQVFRNLDAALKGANCTARNLVKMTVYIRDMRNIDAYRAARKEYFESVRPAAAPAVTLVEVSKLYADDILLEIDAIAAR